MINNVTLVGRLTKDPELRYTPSGVAVSRFTLAVNRTFSNQNGEKEADFINCTVWRKTAESVANYLHKGSLAGVTGRIQTGSFEGQDGKRVYTTDVVAESVQFLEPRGNNQGSGAGPGNNGMSEGHEPPRNWQAETGLKTPVDDPFSNQGPVQVTDDDLPF